MTDTETLNRLTRAIEGLSERLDALHGTASVIPAWEEHTAFRWRHDNGTGRLEAIAHPHGVRLRDLHGIDKQKQALDRNTRQFIAGLPANNALLWGSRGTGKSSLIKALLNEYTEQGLRLIEVEKHHLVDLPDIVAQLYARTERFIVFCDDLSFEADDPSYKALKVVLDGSVSAGPDNVLVYATSNRRHLLPEFMHENLEARHVDGELHQGDTVEEKISLSERFGLWLSFYAFKQDEYLAIAAYWLDQLGAGELDEVAQDEALRWALSRGSRSGRSAWQFARDWAGRNALGD